MDRRVSGRNLGILIAAGVALLVLVAVGFYLVMTSSAPQDAGPQTVRPGSSASTPVSGLATIKASELPKEGVATLKLIDAGGPFPYDRDGITFMNAEKILPKRDRGYYREYTVPTPGSRDRGARRLITGKLGDVYYTDDHYESFRQVLR